MNKSVHRVLHRVFKSHSNSENGKNVYLKRESNWKRFPSSYVCFKISPLIFILKLHDIIREVQNKSFYESQQSEDLKPHTGKKEILWLGHMILKA